MQPLIVAAGRFTAEHAQRIAEGKEPRLDVFELRDALRGRLMDFADLDRSTRAEIPLMRRMVGDSAALAWLAVRERNGADVFLTTGEDIGIPLAMLLKAAKPAGHAMIAHTLHPAKKRVFYTRLKAWKQTERILCYATSEEQLMTGPLGIPAAQVRRIAYHADERFFAPRPEVPIEPDLLCGAGQLLRDYHTLIRATEGLGVRVRIAAGSPWIASELKADRALPEYVDWRKYDRFALRELYARSAIAVVPLFENDYQTGISTILEMMAMGKALIVSKTRGQTDTIVDGENGLYVPPGDAAALRAAIERLRQDPAEAARLGRNARRYVEERAGLDLFTRELVRATTEAHAARFGG
ncbi:MAG: glycosyltransferase [Deltaproteobacteria bacterium]|nr:glycosyltransferase [Deltaproteobacteria bacterium]